MVPEIICKMIYALTSCLNHQQHELFYTCLLSRIYGIFRETYWDICHTCLYQAPSLFTSIWDIAFWFGLMLNALVNGYGHVGTVNSPKAHFSSWASLTNVTLKIKQRYLLSLI